MSFQRRERILAGAAAGLAGLATVWFLFLSGDGRSYQDLAAESDKVSGEIESKQHALQAADRERGRLAELRKRALPADAVLARTLYQNWLRRLAGQADFHDIKLSAYHGGVRRDQCTRIAVTLSCRATLAGLVRFLYDFYSAGYLQQIRRMDVKFVVNSSELEVDFSIEALSLAAAEAKDQLPKESAPAPQTTLANYRDAIVKRNLFGAFVPTESRPQAKTAAASAAAVTGFTEVDGAWQMWVEDRDSGKRCKYAVGATIEAGGGKAVVKSISAEEAVVEIGGHRRPLRLGDKLPSGGGDK